MAPLPIPKPPKPRGGKAILVTPQGKANPLPRAWGPKPGQPYGKYGQGPLAPGHSGPPKPPKPPGVTGAPAAGPPEDPIMAMFRSTLEQIKSSASPVDSNAIFAPYRASETVAGQLAQGAAASDATNSGRASDQYTKAANEADANAASFGIANGAGAGVRQPDATQGLLAQQSQAQQNAAIGAGQAWADLLERTGANAVNRATQTRQQGIDSASESLAASIPSMRQSADQLKLSRDSMQANNKYLYASLDAAGKRAYLAAKTSSDNNIRTNQTSADNTTLRESGADRRSQASIDAANKRNANTVRGAAARAKIMAKKGGVQGLDEVLKAITPGKATGNRPIDGYYVTYPVDQNGINAGGTPLTLFVQDPKTAQTPAGFLANKFGKPVYGQGTTVNAGVTLAAWNKGVGILMERNGYTRAEAQKHMARIQPRPKKSAK